MMREVWSVNGISLELDVDRRTLAKWLGRSDVKSVEQGPNGPLYRLRDAVNVLCDAHVLGDAERRREWEANLGSSYAARMLTDRVERALRRRVPADLRAVREVLATELLLYIQECDARLRGERPKRPKGSEAVSWANNSDADLARAPKSLVDYGCLPTDLYE